MNDRDEIDELAELLQSAGAVVTVDSGRSIRHPCTFCARPAEPAHELWTIGTYTDGKTLTRPVCKRCEKLAELHGGRKS